MRRTFLLFLLVALVATALFTSHALSGEHTEATITLVFVDHEDKPFNIGWMEPKYPFYRYGPNHPQKGELPLEHSLRCRVWNTIGHYDPRWEYHPETNFCLPWDLASNITDNEELSVRVPPDEEGTVHQMSFTVPPGKHTIRLHRQFTRFELPFYSSAPREITTYVLGQNEWTVSGDRSQTIFVRLMDEGQMPPVTNTTETVGLFLLRPVTEWDGTTMTVDLAADINPLFGASKAYREGDELLTHLPKQHILPGEYVLLWANYWPKWDFGSCQIVYTSPDVSEGELDLILAQENVCYAYDTLVVEKKGGIVTTRTERRGQSQPPKDVFFSVNGEVVSVGQPIVIESGSRIQIFGPTCWYQNRERGWTRNKDCPTRYE